MTHRENSYRLIDGVFAFDEYHTAFREQALSGNLLRKGAIGVILCDSQRHRAELLTASFHIQRDQSLSILQTQLPFGISRKHSE